MFGLLRVGVLAIGTGISATNGAVDSISLATRHGKWKIAARFHHTFARAVSEMAARLAFAHGTEIVELNGGIWQNQLLLQACSELLRENGLRVISPIAIPASDGGLSLGQEVISSLS